MVHMGRYPGQVALRTARPAWLCLSIAGLALAGCTQGGTPAGIGLRPSAHAGSGRDRAPPGPHGRGGAREPRVSDIIGSARAPYINALARQGALFTSSYRR